MFEYIVSKYLDSNFIFGALISLLCTLVAIRYQNKLRHLLHNRRIWWRSVCLILICIFSFCLYGFSFYLWYLLPLLVIPVVVSLFALPHEHLIVKNVSSSDEKTHFVWTTAGKLLFEKAKIKVAHDEERADVNLRFYRLLKNKELLSFEFQDYYLPVLEELYKMGAIKLLKEEVSKLEKKDSQLNLLKAYIAHSDLRISDMRHYLEDFLQNPSKNMEGRIVAYLNMLCVADESNDVDLRAKYIALAEDLYFNKHVRHRTLVFDLLFHYDNNGPKVKADEIVENIINSKQDSITSLLDYANMLYNHYRLQNDQEGQSFAFSFIRQRLIETKDLNDKTRLLVDLSMLQPMLNANAGWIEYSSQIFKYSRTYLNHSLDVAFTFISEVLKTLQMAEQVYHISIPDEQYKRLSNEMLNAVKHWEPELRKLIADTPTVMLYRRKELYLRLIDFLKVQSEGVENLCKLQEEKMTIYENIIENCRENDNKREMLHFMNVYCDEIITVNKQIEDLKIPLDTIELNLYRNKYETSYRPSAINYIEEMESIIQQNKNNKSLQYYVLYMAYYSKMLSNWKNECYYFHMFEHHKINICYFNSQTQMLYESIRKDVDSILRNS